MADVENDRWNFRTLLGQGVVKSVGDQVSSEKLVLPFLYTPLGGPVFFAGLLMPIVTVSTLGSQLFAIVVGLAKGHVSLTFQDMLGRVLALSTIVKRAAARRSGARHLRRGERTSSNPVPP